MRHGKTIEGKTQRVVNKLIDDRNVSGYTDLVTPFEQRRMQPLSQVHSNTVISGRKAIAAALRGEDKRVVLVCGPCSIHDPKAAMEYADRLLTLSNKVKDTFITVMRVYPEKPRSGMDWRGIANQGLDGSWQRNRGLEITRELLLYNAKIGLPSATEFLDPLMPQYISDLISWSAIGARTVHSQVHRALASALSMTVGFKNDGSGDIVAAIEGMDVARHGQDFVSERITGVVANVMSRGNRNTHVILRGGTTRNLVRGPDNNVSVVSTNIPNYDSGTVSLVSDLLKKKDLPSRIMIDCSHSNSGKDYTKQPEIFMNVIGQILANKDNIFGIMLESNLKEGSQKVKDGMNGLVYGVSITDSCIGWETTEEIITKANNMLLRK